MNQTVSKGTCAYCGGEFAKSGMKRHLQACAERTAKIAAPATSKKAKAGTILHLSIEGEYLPMYWLHIEMPATATLQQLDQFLRNIWLECCGHLSTFNFGGQSYAAHPMPEFGDKGMNVKLDKLFAEGVQAQYEYDFGSTTHLLIKYAGQREGTITGNQPQIMARNLPPRILCDECGEPATELCTECMWDEKGQLCDKHAANHACGEEMLLPVVNSPRVGVCGYTGED